MLQVPDQPWYMKPLFSCLVGGILPFGAVFIELFFILMSIWQHKFYYIFGFLALVFLILIVTCMEITIVLCYFQLCSEDYRCAPPQPAAAPPAFLAGGWCGRLGVMGVREQRPPLRLLSVNCCCVVLAVSATSLSVDACLVEGTRSTEHLIGSSGVVFIPGWSMPCYVAGAFQARY